MSDPGENLNDMRAEVTAIRAGLDLLVARVERLEQHAFATVIDLRGPAEDHRGTP